MQNSIQTPASTETSHQNEDPVPQVSRMRRRASLRAMNNQLLRERELIRQEYSKLQ